MKLLKCFTFSGLVSGWTQPSYPEFLKMLRERSNVDWGRPVNTEKRLQSRLWSDCPALPLPENAKELKCNRSTCSMICKPGFLATGKKRVACRRKQGEFMWIKELGSCKSCEPAEPEPADENVHGKCETNRLGRRICTFQCPMSSSFDIFNVRKLKITCKCPRGRCAWKKGTKTVDIEKLSCKTAATTTRRTTTRRTTATTPRTTPRPLDDAESDSGEFENGAAHLTASQSCAVDQFTRFASDDGSNRIINGVTAGKGTWPWIVSMGFFRFEFGGASLCGGSIINDRWIITAAHCCRDSIKAKIKVGNFNRLEDDVGEFQVESTTMIKHPLYKSGNGLDWDACLVKVPSLKEAAPASCKNCFTAACLPQKAPVHGRHCWVAGWGHKEEGFDIAEKLQEVGVNLFGWEYCTQKSVYKRVVNKVSELCAGIPDRNNDGLIDGGKDACQGDSGGPLVCDDDGVATMYGLVSWGEGCARKGSPGIYADVFHLRDWIHETVAKN